MDHALVVVEPTESFEELVTEAAAYARGSGAKLVVLSFVTPETFETEAETLETIGDVENVSYGENTILKGHRSSLQQFVEPLIGDSEVEYECHVAVADSDERADEIMDVADTSGCDHVFLHGRRRSPTGKALFGDMTQRLLLNFDGFVTVAMTETGYEQ